MKNHIPSKSLLTPEKPHTPSLQEKHVYCVVSRLLTQNIYISGGYPLSRPVTKEADMVVEIGDTRYCVHFRSLKGSYPEYLADPELMRVAQDSATKLLMRRYAK